MPWATPVDLGRYNGGVLAETLRTITPVGARYGTGTVPPGSLVLSTRAPIGYVIEAESTLAFNQGCKGLVPIRPLDTRFYRYVFLSLADELQAFGQGSTFSELAAETLAALKIPAPPLVIQVTTAEAIERQVSHIDAVISAKTGLLGRLSEKERATIDRLTVPQALGGVADRGREPWKTVALKRLATFFRDGDWIESPYITTEGIRLIQTGNIQPGFYRDQGFRFISDDTFESLNCTEVLPGDVLISRLAGPVGCACLAPDLDTRMVASVDVVIMRPSPAVLPQFLVAYLSSMRHLALAELLARGTTMQRLSRTQVGDMHVPVPPLSEQHRVVEQVGEAMNRINSLRLSLAQQLRLLNERRAAAIKILVAASTAAER